MRMIAICLVLVCVLLLPACAPGVNPPVAKLAAPSARLMEPPAALPDVKEGDDLYAVAADTRAAYTKEAAKLNSLQGYVKTIRKQK